MKKNLDNIPADNAIYYDPDDYKSNGLSDKLSIIAAVVFAIIYSVIRTIQMTSMVEYPSGFHAIGNDYFSVIMYVAFAATLIGIFVCACHDVKFRFKKNLLDMSRPAASVSGFMMLAAGVAALVALVISFQGSSTMTMISSVLCTAGYLAFGGVAFISGNMKPACTIGALLEIIGLLMKAIEYFLAYPVLSHVPQKIMMMAFFIVGGLFWYNLGRMVSGGGKKYTKSAAIAFGFTTAIIGISTIVSNYALMATNGDNWLLLTDTPDIEYMIVTIAIAVTTAAIVIGCKKGSSEAEENAEINSNQFSEETDEEVTEAVQEETAEEVTEVVQEETAEEVTEAAQEETAEETEKVEQK